MGGDTRKTDELREKGSEVTRRTGNTGQREKEVSCRPLFSHLCRNDSPPTGKNILNYRWRRGGFWVGGWPWKLLKEGCGGKGEGGNWEGFLCWGD